MFYVSSVCCVLFCLFFVYVCVSSCLLLFDEWFMLVRLFSFLLLSLCAVVFDLLFVLAIVWFVPCVLIYIYTHVIVCFQCFWVSFFCSLLLTY